MGGTDRWTSEAADRVVVETPAEGRHVDLAAVFGWTEAEKRPFELEIGCGKGKFLVAAARRWPDHDFLAVEQVRKLVRKVRDRAVRERLPNVRLIHGNAKDLVSTRLPPASVHRIHLYFPDPWPKRRHAKHRFIEDPIPDRLAEILEPGGQLLLATDHDPYFRQATARFRAHPAFVGVLPDPFREIPRGGFDAIFEGAGVPVFRGIWERKVER